VHAKTRSPWTPVAQAVNRWISLDIHEGGISAASSRPSASTSLPKGALKAREGVPLTCVSSQSGRPDSNRRPSPWQGCFTPRTGDLSTCPNAWKPPPTWNFRETSGLAAFRHLPSFCDLPRPSRALAQYLDGIRTREQPVTIQFTPLLTCTSALRNRLQVTRSSHSPPSETLWNYGLARLFCSRDRRHARKRARGARTRGLGAVRTMEPVELRELHPGPPPTSARSTQRSTGLAAQ
jgi:hypothetical protein